MSTIAPLGFQIYPSETDEHETIRFKVDASLGTTIKQGRPATHIDETDFVLVAMRGDLHLAEVIAEPDGGGPLESVSRAIEALVVLRDELDAIDRRNRGLEPRVKA